MISYTPEEMVRLELLCYQNPEGLHSIEAAWRDLARKLKAHVEELQDSLEKHHQSHHWKYAHNGKPCPVCSDFGIVVYIFPKPPKIEVTKSPEITTSRSGIL